ncbi:Abi family protein [Nocardia sp. MH4]|uniref:Abi family protein n=1 Tax=Nocardia sp. MH4 TaxID=1768677 RepID=UPI0027E345CD|nr:Abi family protein [Nocardia sp. MH4]
MPKSVKDFKTYDEQLAILTARGMDVGDRDKAVSQLRRCNYYRLSGYWYPFRQSAASGGREDNFYPGTTLDEVISLYTFDSALRTATFDALAPVELSLRAALGYALGEIDECAHLNPTSLSARASGPTYQKWVEDYQNELDRSKEEFIAHHRWKYSGTLPVWVAIEILDWGSLAYLFDFAPDSVRDKLASGYGLSGVQLLSWMRALNVIRNTCAHHGRLFNRKHAFAPKLPQQGRLPEIDQGRLYMRQTFGQLTLIQHLRQASGIPASRMLAKLVASYPHDNRAVPIGRMGVWDGWKQSSLWPAD